MTQKSPEYVRYMYLTGEIVHESPWNRLGEDALCEADYISTGNIAPTSALALIQGLLTVDPAERLTLAHVYRHRRFIYVVYIFCHVMSELCLWPFHNLCGSGG
jgi:hypothetical protein